MSLEAQLKTFVNTFTNQIVSLQEQIDALSARLDAIQSGHGETEPMQSTSTPEIEIVEVKSRVTEANDSWSKFAWRLKVRNRSQRPVVFNATVEFQDGEGFIVADNNAYDLRLPPHAEQTFTGYEMIDVDVAPNVAGVAAKVELAD